MPTKLNQIVAVEKTAKVNATAAITGIYHLVQKPELFAGIERTYAPLDDDGVQLPAESTKVQQRAENLLSGDLRAAWVRMHDLVATKDKANTQASADVVVDGSTIATNVPVTYLIWLEKQLTHLATVVGKMPTLDPAVDWHTDNDGDWATQVTQTVKTAKVPRNHVLAEATDKHPAQVQMYTEDVVVGRWSTTKRSGALPGSRQRELLAKVAALAEAVKFAREQANGLDVTDQWVGEAIFDYLLG